MNDQSRGSSTPWGSKLKSQLKSATNRSHTKHKSQTDSELATRTSGTGVQHEHKDQDPKHNGKMFCPHPVTHDLAAPHCAQLKEKMDFFQNDNFKNAVACF